MARYRIDYFKEGVAKGSTPWAGTLDDVRKIAQDGLIRHDSDFARIIDVDGSGVEVDSVKREL